MSYNFPLNSESESETPGPRTPDNAPPGKSQHVIQNDESEWEEGAKAASTPSIPHVVDMRGRSGADASGLSPGRISSRSRSRGRRAAGQPPVDPYNSGDDEALAADGSDERRPRRADRSRSKSTIRAGSRSRSRAPIPLNEESESSAISDVTEGEEDAVDPGRLQTRHIPMNDDEVNDGLDSVRTGVGRLDMSHGQGDESRGTRSNRTRMTYNEESESENLPEGSTSEKEFVPRQGRYEIELNSESERE